MRWKQKDANNDRCGISDCNKYRISQYTQSGDDIYIVYFGGQEIAMDLLMNLVGAALYLSGIKPLPPYPAPIS